MENLINVYQNKLRKTSTDFVRYLLPEIDWADRMISLTGARGSGKTTLLLQHIKQNFTKNEKCLYISLDNLHFMQNNLLDFASDFVKQGGEYLFIDEVHKYPTWSIELKNIYDQFDELKVVFTGSSILEIYKSEADLSRRVVNYTLEGLSFREFIEFEKGIKLPKVSLVDILKNHAEISNMVCSKIKPLAEFTNYLKYGFYPFFKENKNSYLQKLHNTINLSVEVDLMAVHKLDYASINKIKKLLYLLAQNTPYKANITTLASQIEASRNSVIQFLNMLERAKMLNLLRTGLKSDGLLTKPEKIYLGNTNLAHALVENQPDIGMLRETFFINQIGVKHKINYPRTGDFLINDRYTFEVGGKNKTNEQIRNEENAYIAADGIEYGYKNKIPLWMFGLTY
ncbi:MAG: ATP-binding protein [Bacteroidia bacterium]